MKKQNIVGIILFLGTIIVGRLYLSTPVLFFRLLAGLGLGYALSRGAMGFAGSVNRAYRFGSTKLMRILMFLFVITCIGSVGYLFQSTEGFDLWVNPINFGLLLGGTLFGIGMALSTCCASGVLTDIVSDLPRGLITLTFFGMGVYVGFPLQNTADWINVSWFTSGGWNGVYLPDLFQWDGLNGYLGAIVLTLLFAGIVTQLSYKYEKKRIADGKYRAVPSEVESDKKHEAINTLCPTKAYDKLFVRPWSMEFAAVAIAIIFIVMMGITKAGWGASTPYGHWFGRLLILFGMSPEQVASFAAPLAETPNVGPYTMPFFNHPINVQNIAIAIGAISALLLAGKYTTAWKEGFHLNGLQAVQYALGGFLMGFGTRLSNGCNVGALYTPIANFSLSGWIFLIVMVCGGVLGNKLLKAVFMKK